MLSPDDVLDFDPKQFEAKIKAELVAQHTIVFALQFSPCGQYLAGASSFGRIAIWDISAALSGNHERSAGARTPLVSFQAARDSIFSLEFVHDVLVCGTNSDVRAFRLQDILSCAASGNTAGIQPVFAVKPPTSAATVEGVETNGLASRGSALYTGGGDSQIHEWDLNTMRCVRSFVGHSDYVHCVALSASNGQLVSGSEDGTVKFWDTNTARCLRTIELPLPKRERKPDAGAKDKTAKKSASSKPAADGKDAKDSKDSKHKSKKEVPREVIVPWVPCVALDPSGNWLATGGLNSPQIWHVDSLMPACNPKSAGQSVVRSAAFAGDDIVTVGDNNQLCRWTIGGELRGQAALSSASNYTVAVNNAGPRVIAVGGVGASIDIFINASHRAFSLVMR